MDLILTGGGTAGHVIPNIALIEELRELDPDIEIAYIGSKSGLEQKLLEAHNIEFKSVATGKLRRYFSLRNAIDFLKVPVGILQSYFIIKKLKPKLVFSKGGYVALPVVIAAKWNRVPIIIHESDAVEGLTTRITKKYASEYWSAFGIPGSKKIKLPIRKFLQNGDPTKFKSHKPLLLVMGGSLGAKVINEFISKNINALLEKFTIIHITGKGKQTFIATDGYTQFEFVGPELADMYASAEIVLSRAGAGVISELSALNKKAILIPLATDKSRGEQLKNAQAFCSENAGEIILEQELDYKKFKQALKKLEIKNPVTTAESKNQAASLLIETLGGSK